MKSPVVLAQWSFALCFFGSVVNVTNGLSLGEQVSLFPFPDSQVWRKSGDSLSANCYIPAADAEALTVQWFRGDEDEKHILPSFPSPVPATGVLGNMFILKPVRAEDTGKYTCKVINGSDSVSKSFTLNVYEGVNMQNVESNQQAEVGNDAQLNCSATASGPVSVFWRFRNGTSIPEDDKYEAFGTSLSIRNVQKSDAGYYECIGNQTIVGAGKDGADLDDRASTTINFTVIQAPEFRMSHAEMKQNSSGLVTLVCDAEGIPSPEVYDWMRNDTNITRETKDMEDCFNRSCTFKFAPEYLYDYFRCVASSPKGSASKTFRVIEGISDFQPSHSIENPNDNAFPKVAEGTTLLPFIASASSVSAVGSLLFFSAFAALLY